jgi:hypothetical protein
MPANGSDVVHEVALGGGAIGAGAGAGAGADAGAGAGAGAGLLTGGTMPGGSQPPL